MSLSPVLVTGATGNLGRAFLEAAGGSRLEVIGAARDPGQVRAMFPEAGAVRLDFTSTATFRPALEGVASVFLVRPPAISRVGPTIVAFLEAAREAGVRHVVFVSVSGAETNTVVPHHRVEQYLRREGPSHTILRPGFFAQNLGDAYRWDIREEDRLTLPAGDAGVAFVDVRDVGEVAVDVFRRPELHRGHAYTLTGPAALDFHQVAALLGGALGRKICYEPLSPSAYAARLWRRGLPLPQIVVQTILHTRLRTGVSQDVDPTLTRLLGRPATGLPEYVRDHLELWR